MAPRTDGHDLTMANEDYLETIYRLSRDAGEEGIRSVDVAEHMGVSKASVNKALATLQEAGYVEQSRYGKVRLTLKKESKYTVFSIFNSCQIDRDVDYSLLFDRFYRPDSSRTSSTGGHGIGLSIAKRIVTLHGGTIEAQPSDTGLSINVRLSNKLKPIKQKKVI